MNRSRESPRQAFIETDKRPPVRMFTAPHERFVAVTADGHKLAFNAESDITRIWSLPFDPLLGKVRGEGDPVTSTSATPWGADLTADGRKLAVVLTRRGEHPARVEVTERSLADEGERLLISDGRSRDTPRWSPDGRLLLYDRQDSGTLLNVATGEEQSVTTPAGGRLHVFDWSPSGDSIVGVTDATKPKTNEVWVVPVRGNAAIGSAARRLTRSAEYDVFQTTFSPDGRWICFNAVRAGDYRTSTLFVVPSTGGPWTQVTEGRFWDDNPRWAPDGNTIYFLSSRARGGVCSSTSGA